MEIGTGIAIAGVWVFAGMLGKSDTVSALGLLFGVVVAVMVTAWLI